MRARPVSSVDQSKLPIERYTEQGESGMIWQDV
jgi:hypothetical protein